MTHTDEDIDIKVIAYETITKGFCYGKYDNFKVKMMMENGYFNVTDLIKNFNKQNPNKPEKTYNHWRRKVDTDNTIKLLSKDTGLAENELIIIKRGGNNIKIAGTYVHPILIADIVSTLLPAFKIKILRITNNYFAKKALDEKKKLEEEVEELEKTVEKKDAKIDKLNKNVEILIKQANKNETVNKKNHSIIKKSESKINKLLELNEEMYDKNDLMASKLEEISNDRVVPPQNKKYIHKLIVIYNRIDLDESSSEDSSNSDSQKSNSDSSSESDSKQAPRYEYSTFRLMRNNKAQRIKNHKRKYPNMKEILESDGAPNAINLWIRIKEKLNGKYIKTTGSHFNLTKKYTQVKLIEAIKQIHDERLEEIDLDN
jgi:hypothetical protein